MAVVRARSSPPYGLFAAVTFAILATGAAVVFYIMWSKSLDEHDKAVANLAKIANANDQRLLPGVIGNNYDDKSTALTQLNAMVTKLTSDLTDARRSASRLTDEVNANKSTIDVLTKARDKANSQTTAAQNSMDKQKKEFDSATTAMQDQLTALQQQVAAANESKNGAVSKGQADLNDALQKAQDERRQLVLNLDDAQSQIARLNAEIFDLRLRITNFGSGKTEVSVGEPDGKIIRVNGASGEVYINLGKKDRIRPGMPFTAYDPRVGVRFGSDAAAKGNGSLEVIEVGQDTSLCRITYTTPNRAIQANDLIANLVYHNDRTRKFRFTIFGDFDLDGDGVATAAERARIITLIQSWGGQVDTDVSSQTDYLVLGSRPRSPMIDESPADPTATSPATEPAASGITGSVAGARSQDQARYEDLEVSAKRLAIPVLNQNRFLAMVGYYNTTVVRY